MTYEEINLELEEDEKVLKVIRKHWFIITLELIASLAMMVIPMTVLLVLLVVSKNSTLFTDFDLSHYLPLTFYFLNIWILLSLITGFISWTNFYLDYWVITDRRIIVYDQVSLFSRKVSSFRLERLQDIKYSLNGIVQTLLKFGTVTIETASHTNSFKSEGLPVPDQIYSIIQKATDERVKIMGRDLPNLNR